LEGQVGVLTQIAAEAALDGIYVLRTSIPADQLNAPGLVTAYKNLAHVERDFRSIKIWTCARSWAGRSTAANTKPKPADIITSPDD
jgi:hypothetical protein